MEDVVRIDIMPMTALKVSVPFNVQNITEAVVTVLKYENGAPVYADGEPVYVSIDEEKLFAARLLSLNLGSDAIADAEMGEGTTHKVTEKRDTAGIVRTHTLQVPIEVGFQAVRQQQNALQQTDFHIVLTTCDGTRYLAYGLPNTSQFTIDDQKGETAQMTVKAVVQSMSGFVKIIDNIE